MRVDVEVHLKRKKGPGERVILNEEYKRYFSMYVCSSTLVNSFDKRARSYVCTCLCELVCRTTYPQVALRQGGARRRKAQHGTVHRGVEGRLELQEETPESGQCCRHPLLSASTVKQQVRAEPTNHVGQQQVGRGFA